MPLGICVLCEQLKAIEPREPRVGYGRQVNWYPVPHLGLDNKPCDGSNFSVDGAPKPKPPIW